MNADERRSGLDRVTETVIGCAQCLNYLKATGLTVCLLINFGNPRLTVKRIVLNY